MPITFRLFPANLRRTLARTATLLAACAAGQAAHAATTLVINSMLPPSDFVVTHVIKPWAADVARVTQGRVVVSIPPASVVPPNQLWLAVTGDVVDGAYLFNGLIPSQLPLEQIAGLPFVAGSAAATTLAYWNTYQTYFAKAGDFRNVKLLALFTEPAGEIFSFKRPIVKPADFHGVRMWALPGVPQRLLEGSGAGIEATPAVQIGQLVAAGTVDALAGVSGFVLDSQKAMPYVKFETRIKGGITAPGFSLIVNKAKWESIAPADRKAIEAISGANFASRLAALDRFNRAIRARAVKHGLKVLEASPALEADLHRRGQSMFTQWLAVAKSKGVDGNAALKYFEAQAQAHAQ